MSLIMSARIVYFVTGRHSGPAMTNPRMDVRAIVRPLCRVGAGPHWQLERSTVRGPAIIGRGSRIANAYVGPYTAIGEGVTIDGAELEYSIVLEGSSIRDLEGRLEASLIGKNVRIARGPAQPRAYRFVVGDNAEIAIL